MRVYHGTNLSLASLSAGSFVTLSSRDAWRFGYRKSVVTKSPSVFVYAAEVDESALETDANRDRAFVLRTAADVTLVGSSPVWASPFKLTRFALPRRQSGGPAKSLTGWGGSRRADG